MGLEQCTTFRVVALALHHHFPPYLLREFTFLVERKWLYEANHLPFPH